MNISDDGWKKAKMEQSLKITKGFIEEFMRLYSEGMCNSAWGMIYAVVEIGLAFTEPDNRVKAIRTMQGLVVRVGDSHYEDAADYESRIAEYNETNSKIDTAQE